MALFCHAIKRDSASVFAKCKFSCVHSCQFIDYNLLTVAFSLILLSRVCCFSVCSHIAKDFTSHSLICLIYFLSLCFDASCLIKDIVRSSVKVPEFNKHLKKAGGHIGRNVVEITIKMKTIVRKTYDKNLY